MPTDIPGQIKVEFSVNDDDRADENVQEPSARQENKRKKQKLFNWKKAEDISNMERKVRQTLEEEHPELSDKSPYELFSLYFEDMLHLLVEETNRCAAQNNNHEFAVSEEEMRKFCGVFLFSGIETHAAPTRSVLVNRRGYRSQNNLWCVAKESIEIYQAISSHGEQ